MGFVQIPESPHVGSNKAVLHLDRDELTHTIELLQLVVDHLSLHPSSSVGLLSTPQLQISAAPVQHSSFNAISTPLKGLQTRSGLDLGTGSVGTLPERSSQSVSSSSSSQASDSKVAFTHNDQSSIPFVSASIPTSKSSHVISCKPAQPLPPIGGHLTSNPGAGTVGNHRSLPAQGLDIAISGMNLQEHPDVSLLKSQSVKLEAELARMSSAFPDRIWDFASASSKYLSTDNVQDLKPCSRGPPGSDLMPEMNKSGNNLANAVQLGHSVINADRRASLQVGTVTRTEDSTGGREFLNASSIAGAGDHVASRRPSSGGSQGAIRGTIGKGVTDLVGQTRGAQSEEHCLSFPRGHGKGEGCSGVGGLVRVPEHLSKWRGKWSTAAAEHNKESITTMIYSQALEELLGGEAQSGWLMTASGKLLNLWQCSASGWSSEPSLQLMHSQFTEFVMEDMDIDTNAKVLCASCAHPRDVGFCISLHSLATDNFLKFKGMIRIPDGGYPALKQQLRNSLRLLHVVSMQPLGGPLQSSVAAAVGGEVLVYELSAASTSPTGAAQPRALWKAHDAPISFMHRSNFACALFTGGSDGSIHLWDLKSKPTAPVRQYMQKNHITGIATLNANTISSCSTDGVIQLWDIRSNGASVASINPDGKPILNMSVIPLESTISFTTRMGLYCLELTNGTFPGHILSPLMPLPPVGPCTDMKWNTKTQEVYVSGVDGTICVYGRT